MAHVVSPVVPRDNHLRLELPRGDWTVAAVSIDVVDDQNAVLRSAELKPLDSFARFIDYHLAIQPGAYRLSLGFLMRPAGNLDKNQGGGWTRMGVQHQIRLEGEDYRIPPPVNEAK